MKTFFWVLGLSVSVALNVRAIPLLQLDASNAIYDNTSQTTIAQANQFTLYALLNGHNFSAQDHYYVVAGLQPMNAPAGNYGSFMFNGSRVHVTGDMTSGNPFGWNNSHGVYPTFFTTFAFNWNTANRFNDYDVSLVGGTHNGPSPSATGNSLYMGFDVDVSGLLAGTRLWFDLVEVNASGQVDAFAPFSHVDQSQSSSVPDGGATAILLGVGLTGVAVLRRKARV
jgi:hypothetical protein